MSRSAGGEDDRAFAVDTDATLSPPVLSLRGDLDLATAPDLEAAGRDLPGSPETVILDLAELAFVDSSGITAIVRLHRIFSTRGGQVVLRRPRPFVREILHVAGLDRVLTIER